MRAAALALAALATTSGAQPVFRSSTAINPGGDLVFARPSGVVPGDVLIAVLYLDLPTSTVAPDQAWTLIDEQRDLSNLFHAVWFVRVATSAEPAQYTFAGSGVGPHGAAAMILAFSGVEGADPVVAFATAKNPQGQTSFAAPALSPGADHLHLFSVVYDGANEPLEWTTPPGTSALGNQYTVTAFASLVPGGGTTSAQTTVYSGPPRSSGYASSIALRRAADGGLPAFKARSDPTLTFPMPAGTAAGDLLLMGLNLDSFKAEVARDAGWTVFDSHRADAGNFMSAWLFRVAGTTEATTTVLPLKNLGAHGAGAVLTAWRGVDTSQPLGAVQSSLQAGPTFSAPLLVPGARGLQIFGVASLDGQVAWPASPGAVERGNSNHQVTFSLTPGASAAPSTTSSATDVAVVSTFLLFGAAPDAGVDAGAPDAGSRDAATPDAGAPPDAGAADAATADAGDPDAGTVDAGQPDGGNGVSDGGVSATNLDVGCGCDATAGNALLAVLLAIARLAPLRRRGPGVKEQLTQHRRR
jgi:hypothetical protein